MDQGPRMLQRSHHTTAWKRYLGEGGPLSENKRGRRWKEGERELHDGVSFIQGLPDSGNGPHLAAGEDMPVGTK